MTASIKDNTVTKLTSQELRLNIFKMGLHASKKG